MIPQCLQTKEHLEFAIEAGGLGIWKVEFDEGSMVCSDTCRANFGIKPGADFSYEDVAQMIHPEDRLTWRNEVANAIHERRDFGIDYRINTLVGELRWIRARGRVVYDDSGKPLYLFGITQNITELKSAERGLRDFPMG